MKLWFLLSHNPRMYERVLIGLESLDITHYTPLMTVIKKRSDSKSCVRIKNKPLFPSYIFLNFDPKLVHTTTVAQITGVNGLVRSGGKTQTIPPAVISTLRKMQLKILEEKTNHISIQNIPDLMLEEINKLQDEFCDISFIVNFLKNSAREGFMNEKKSIN